MINQLENNNNIEFFYDSRKSCYIIQDRDKPEWSIEVSELELLENNTGDSLKALLETRIQSLKNKFKEDTKNLFGEEDTTVNKFYLNEPVNEVRYPPCNETDMIDYTMVNPLDVNFNITLDGGIIDEHLLRVNASNVTCSSCNDTGIVDSYMYGQYECTACDQPVQSKEKEISAWDKKLKEELENGDDTWGSIAKKYRK